MKGNRPARSIIASAVGRLDHLWPWVKSPESAMTSFSCCCSTSSAAGGATGGCHHATVVPTKPGSVLLARGFAVILPSSPGMARRLRAARGAWSRWRPAQADPIVARCALLVVWAMGALWAAFTRKARPSRDLTTDAAIVTSRGALERSISA